MLLISNISHLRLEYTIFTSMAPSLSPCVLLSAVDLSFSFRI